MMNELLKSAITGHSKKLWVLIVGVLMIAYADRLWIGTEEVESIKWILGSYLLGQGIADFGKSAALLEKKEDKNGKA